MMHYPSKEQVESEIAKVRARREIVLPRTISDSFERTYPGVGCGPDVVAMLIKHYGIEGVPVGIIEAGET